MCKYQLYRVFYYTADPLKHTTENPLSGDPIDFEKTARPYQQLIDTVESLPDFAVRKGTLLQPGWEVGPAAFRGVEKGTKKSVVPKDLRPKITQKGVDLRIGLDIASLALKHLVDAVVLVTGDSDMIPAMKLARREGLRVYLDTLNNQGARHDLKVHADIVF